MVLLIKIILALLLLFTVYSLFRALFAMLKNDPYKPSMSHYLGRRVLFSVIAIVVLLLLLLTGFIGLNPRPY